MLRLVAIFGLLCGAASAECTSDRAEIRWPGGGHARFSIEIADTVEQRGRGLMYRKHLPIDTGMLFVYQHPQRVSFWMKNTLISLDLLFIGADGRVNHIHPNAVPGDLTPMPGPVDTSMVLEINGGLAHRLGLVMGAEIRHPSLDQGIALWPC